MMTSRIIRRVPDMLSQLGLSPASSTRFVNSSSKPPGPTKLNASDSARSNNTAARSSVGIFLANKRRRRARHPLRHHQL